MEPKDVCSWSLGKKPWEVVEFGTLLINASHKKQVDSQSSKHKMIVCPLVEGVNKSGVGTGIAKHPSTF